jgi:acetoacetyl-CoA synthetase
MTLVRQLRVLLGRDISLEAFMADPTLTGLSAAVRRAARSADAPAVVRLAAGDPQLPPLFFLHDAWGDVDVYWPVAQLLTRTGPVYGVRNDLHREDGARRSVAELATAAAREIDRTAPTGPVRLAGHSFGGLVAFEVAGLLGDTGREVEFVGLLDSMPPRTNLGPLERAVTHSALRVASVVPGLRREPLRMFLRGRWRSPQRNDEPGTPDDAAAFTASSRLYHEHRWRPWAGPVTYFQARRRLPAVQHMLHTWRRIAPRLTVVEVPGAHHDLVGQANVEVLAARLSEALPSADVPTGAVT